MAERAWLRVASAAQFQDGRSRTFQLEGVEIFVCRRGEEFFAAENACSHAGFPLADGDVEGGIVLCPLHGATFDLRSGEPLSPPADAPIRVFPVRLSDGSVWVALDGASPASP
ncbi:MAG: non-heme iron oxygenase ferredoxin subunit [Acidobacteriota bacterium]|nr:non-heme iron oxygenase ferredoxin subunit [Acidobacteriota bacterium]